MQESQQRYDLGFSTGDEELSLQLQKLQGSASGLRRLKNTCLW